MDNGAPVGAAVRSNNRVAVEARGPGEVSRILQHHFQYKCLLNTAPTKLKHHSRQSDSDRSELLL